MQKNILNKALAAVLAASVLSSSILGTAAAEDLTIADLIIGAEDDAGATGISDDAQGSFGQATLVWSDAETDGTKIITAEMKDGSFFGAFDELLAEEMSEEDEELEGVKLAAEINRLALEEPWAGFEALKIYILDGNGEMRATDGDMRLEIMFTDEGKAAGLLDGTMEVEVLGLDESLEALDIAYGYDEERQVL